MYRIDDVYVSAEKMKCLNKDNKLEKLIVDFANHVRYVDAAKKAYTGMAVANMKEMLGILGYDVGELFLLAMYSHKRALSRENRDFVRQQRLIEDIAEDKKNKYGFAADESVVALSILMASDASKALGRKAAWAEEDDYKVVRHLLCEEIAQVLGFDWTHLTNIDVNWESVVPDVK